MKFSLLVGALACAGSLSAQITPLGGGSSPLFVNGTPQPGGTLQISPLPAPAPLVLLGTSRVDIPLASMGAGCNDTLVPALDLVSPTTFSLSIPNDPGVIGFTFYAQGALAGVAPCHLGFYFTLSEAVEITIQ
jgi:hypothetical protein